MMKRSMGQIVLSALLTSSLAGQEPLSTMLAEPIVRVETSAEQHRAHVTQRIAPLEAPDTAADWQAAAQRLRTRLFDQVVFRGVPNRWRRPSPTVVWGPTLTTGAGYHVRKLRIEVLPDVWIPGLLYEPDTLTSPVPVVLNVNGHEATGKSTPYKQRRCINLVKRGMIALNLEWIGMGQLRQPGWRHNHLAKLDLCGCSGLSVFYLAMSRGLDVLLDHSHADHRRVAMTGLSGGGWQTILLSSLDTRVTLAVPVAGHSSLLHRLEHRSSIGDLEQIPTDLALHADYAHLNALMVPRPLLMIYNSRDNCCFVSHTVIPTTYTPVIPFYQQAGVAEHLKFYENQVPGTHNYERDNREQLYAFLNRHFFPDEPRSTDDHPSDDEIFSAEQLHVPLPGDGRDFLSLAKDLARQLPQPLNVSKAHMRDQLKSILHWQALQVSSERYSGATETTDGLSVRRLRLRTGPHWTVGAVMVSRSDPSPTRLVILMSDDGFVAEAERIAALTDSGSRVLAVDPLLIGQAKPPGDPHAYAMLLACVGARPLGIQAAQLSGLAEFATRVSEFPDVDIETHGPRSSLIARCAAALDATDIIKAVHAHNELASLKRLLEAEARYRDAPEAYCFGLLKSFDVPLLIEMAQTANAESD